MSTDMQNHAVISKEGQVDLPLWAKVLGWVVGLCLPFSFIGATWFGNMMWDMNQRMTRMEAKLETNASDRYTGSQAQQANALLQLQIDINRQNIEDVQSRLGMRSVSITERKPSRQDD